MAVAPPERFTSVQLDEAVLCQDCEAVSNTPYRYCPVCGSQSLLQLARVLNRETTEAPPAVAPWTAWRESRRLNA